MNRIVTIVACALLATRPAAPAAAQAAAAPTIGVIDVNRVIQASAMGKDAIARIQKPGQAPQEELVKRNKELRDLEQRIQEQGKSLSEDAMEKLQKDYQAKAVDLKRFQDDAQRELEENQRKELKTLEERIMPVIYALGKEMGYNLIFNKFQSGLVFASEDMDITGAEITRFNTQIAAPAAPKTTVAPPATAAPAPPKAAAPTPTPAPKKN